MNPDAAAAILGLPLHYCTSQKTIRDAWKLKLLSVHPDKCPDASAKGMTQAANEARDVLIERLGTCLFASYDQRSNAELDNELRKKKEELAEQYRKIMKALEKTPHELFKDVSWRFNTRPEEPFKTKSEESFKRRPEEAFKTKSEDPFKTATSEKPFKPEKPFKTRPEKETLGESCTETKSEAAKPSQKSDDKLEKLYQRAQELRRERYAKNRKKRPEGARVHRKIGDYKEGRALLGEIKEFVKERFTASDVGKVAAKGVLAAFKGSRNSTSQLQVNLFQRHFKRLLLAEWPLTLHTVFKGERCYSKICLRSP